MKKYLLMLAALLISAAIAFPATDAPPSQEETQLWELVKDTKDIEELDIYLETYPDGRWVKNAMARKWAIVKSEQSIEQIEAYVQQNPDSPFLDDAEKTIWQLVKDQDTIPVYRDYIRKYPKSRYRTEAEQSIQVIEERNTWLVVRKFNTIEQLTTFIRENPDSRFVNEAREMLWQMVRSSKDIDVLKDYIAGFPGTKQAKQAEQKIWKLVEATKDTYTIKKFLAENPDSRFRGLARLRLMRLQKRAATLQMSDTLILDNVTRLVWQRRDLGVANWDAAITLCSESRLNEMEDWRLPDKEELRSLYNVKHFLPDFVFTDYWTSMVYHKDEKGAWMVDVNLPLGNVDYKKNRHHVLCVRELE